MFSRQAIFEGIRWAVLGKAAAQLISWGSTILVIRLLSPADYGLVALAGVPIGLLAIVSSLGLDEVIVRRPHTDTDDRRRALGALLLANALLYAALCLGSGLYADNLGVPELRRVIPVLGLQLLIGAFGQVPAALLERALKIREITRVEVAALIAGSLCSLGLALQGFGAWALIGATLTSQLVRTLGLSLAAGVPPWPGFSLGRLRGELGFAGNVLSNRGVWYLTQTLDELLIGKWLGQQTLGLYSVGKNFAMLPLQKIAAIVHQISFPSIAHSRGEARRALVAKGLSLLCFATFPVYFAVAATAEPLTALLFGSKWQGAAAVLALLSLLMPVKTLNNFLGTATAAAGHPGIRLVSQLALLATTLLAVWIGHADGLAGILHWLLGGHYLILPLLVLNYCRALPLSVAEVARCGGRHLLCAAAAFGLVGLTPGPVGSPWVTLPLNCIIFGVGYLALARLFSRSDLRRLWSLARYRTLD